jgi:hypothetical protein
MKNTIFIILGLGGLFYYFKNKNKSVTPVTPVTPKPTTTTKPKTKPKTKPTTMAPLPPPPYKVNDILKVKLPYLSDTAYNLPFGTTAGQIKEGIYLGYSPVYKDFIKLRATYYSGIYNAPNTKDVWVNSKKWSKF